MTLFFSEDTFVHEVKHGADGFDVSTTHTVTGYEVRAAGLPYTRVEHHVKREHEEAIRRRVREDLGVTDGNLTGGLMLTSGGDVTELRHTPSGVFVRGGADGVEERRALVERLVAKLWSTREV